MRKLMTDEMVEFMREHAKGLFNHELADLINWRFGTNFNKYQLSRQKHKYGIKSNVNSGDGKYNRTIPGGELTRFKKGHEPFNKGKKGWYPKGSEKTWFKKGYTPMNHKPVDSERVNTDGYAEIKIKEPDVWNYKHVKLWQDTYGPVPKGCAIIFGDGDKTNISLDNLICVTRKQLLGLNRYNLIQDDAELTKTAINIVDLKHKIAEVRRKAK